MTEVVKRHSGGKPARTISFFLHKNPHNTVDANPLSCSSPVGRYPVLKEVPKPEEGNI